MSENTKVSSETKSVENRFFSDAICEKIERIRLENHMLDQERIKKIKELLLEYLKYLSPTIHCQLEDCSKELELYNSLYKFFNEMPVSEQNKLVDLALKHRDELEKPIEKIKEKLIDGKKVNFPKVSYLEQRTSFDELDLWTFIQASNFYEKHSLEIAPTLLTEREASIYDMVRQVLRNQSGEYSKMFASIDGFKPETRSIIQKKHNSEKESPKKIIIKSIKPKKPKRFDKAVQKFIDVENPVKQDSKNFRQFQKEILQNKSYLISIGKGNLEVGRALVKKLSEKKWYRTKDLNNKEIEILKQLGYTKSGNNEVFSLEGKPESVIAFVEGSENLAHFSYKYMFYDELKKFNPELEYTCRISNNEVDIVIEYHGKKIAIEIETAIKAINRLLSKIVDLETEFDMIFYGCKKNDLGHFENISSEKLYVGTFGNVLSQIKRYLISA